MDFLQAMQHLDAAKARAFVEGARHVIDALLIEAERVEALRTPAPRDYMSAALDRTAPAGGWLGVSELRRTTQALSEAVAAERWLDGVLVTLRFLRGMGG